MKTPYSKNTEKMFILLNDELKTYFLEHGTHKGFVGEKYGVTYKVK